MVILWLAMFAATASKRAQFVVSVDVNNCYNNGEALNSESCDYSYSKRDDNPNVVFSQAGLSVFSAIAGLGALEW